MKQRIQYDIHRGMFVLKPLVDFLAEIKEHEQRNENKYRIFPCVKANRLIDDRNVFQMKHSRNDIHTIR